MVDLETGVDATVEADANGENGQCESTIAASVGGCNQGETRSVLTNAVDDLTRGHQGEAFRADHPVSHNGNEHGEQPHGQVGQRAEQTVRLEREAEHLLHVSRQLRHQCLVTVVVTHVCEQNRVEWQRLHDSLEGNWRALQGKKRKNH